MRTDGPALIAALKRECLFVLRWPGWRRLESLGPLRLYEREERGRRIRLVVTGVGGKRAVAGVTTLLERSSPSGLVVFGYGGGLDAALEIGDLVWGTGAFLWESQSKRLIAGPRLLPPSREIWDRLSGGLRIREGAIISADRCVRKRGIRLVLPRGLLPAVLELETYPLALAFREREMPLIGLRAVSDELELEPAPDLMRWMDEEFQLNGRRLILDLLRRPGRLGLLMRLQRRSRRAAASLAVALRHILDVQIEI